MGQVISFIDKLKKKQHEHEIRASRLIDDARKAEAEDKNEWMLTYVRLAAEELKHATQLKKQILNIENPHTPLTNINLTTAPIEEPNPVDFTP